MKVKKSNQNEIAKFFNIQKTEIISSIRKNLGGYIATAIVSSVTSILVFLGTTGGAILALPERVSAQDGELAELKQFIEIQNEINTKQNLINEKQTVQNEAIVRLYESIDGKLDILIAQN